MDASIINFEEARKSLILKKAFKWAKKEMYRIIGYDAQPISLEFKEDGVLCDPSECVVSVFYDEITDTALLRRDWLREGGVKYDLLINYKEVKQKFPKTAQKMLDNGMRLYHHFDGPNGGITRLINSAF